MDIDSQVIDDAIKAKLGNLLRAKAFFRRCTVEQLHSFIDAAQGILDTKEAEANRIAKAEFEAKKKRLSIYNKLKSICESEGMTYEEFMGEVSPNNTTLPKDGRSLPRKVRYKCTYEGADYFWRGGGYTPKVFKAVMQLNSCTKGAFLMPEEEHFIVDSKLLCEVPEDQQARVDELAALYDKANKG